MEVPGIAGPQHGDAPAYPYDTVYSRFQYPSSDGMEHAAASTGNALCVARKAGAGSIADTCRTRRLGVTMDFFWASAPRLDGARLCAPGRALRTALGNDRCWLPRN